MLWECSECGTGGIAGSLDFCPGCFEPRITQDVAEKPAATPAPEGVTDEPDSDGTFPADDEGEASPSHGQDQEDEEYGPDHNG